MKKDNRLLQEDINIFQKKCNKKLLTSILIFIKVTLVTNIPNTSVTNSCHQHKLEFKIIWVSRALNKSASTKQNSLLVLSMVRLNSQKPSFSEFLKFFEIFEIFWIFLGFTYFKRPWFSATILRTVFNLCRSQGSDQFVTSFIMSDVIEVTSSDPL